MKIAAIGAITKKLSSARTWIAHFLVHEGKGPNGEAGFVGALLEIGFFSWDRDHEVAIQQLCEQLEEFMNTVNVDGLIEAHTRTTADLWFEYQKMLVLYGSPEYEGELNLTSTGAVWKILIPRG